ncbi:MAG: hypothetical protein U5N86_04635 [Planctomycetota bacterium]|nr:hypothetical protein [Planctomycetota bacterium]
MTCQAAQVGDSSWTAVAGSGSALSLSDQGSASSHSWDIAISVMPTTSGVKTAFAFAIETEYV